GIDYDSFREGSRFIHFLLGPTVVALGYVLYEQVRYIKGNTISIVVSVLAGSITSVASVVLMSKLFGIDAQIIYSMAPKSVTTPIALSLSEKYHGIQALTAVSVVVTGIFGSIIGPVLFKYTGIKTKMARGLALGAASHAVGTAKALELGAVEGAFGGLAIGLMGFLTALLLPIVEQLLM
ncbi:MAG: LrgB family protein, partial [Bacteroidota bacterium]|nr:LrgB family protein [Bacteroidota bacterium]